MTVGSTMMVTVSMPLTRLYPRRRVILKTSSPKRPYTMEGMPASVSVVRRITFTALSPRRAYSLRYMALPTPSGTASSSAHTVMVRVLIIAGSIEQLSEVYLRANSPRFRLGTPFTRTKASSSASTPTVTAAAAITRARAARAPRCLCFFICSPFPA